MTTLATALDELGLTNDGGAQDARVERYIMAGSELMSKLCNRNLYRAADHVERVAGAGGVYLVVNDHRPIVSIDSIVWDPRDGTTTTVDSDDYAISDAGAGKIEYVGGAWDSSRVQVQRIERTPTGRALPRYKVTYTGGWITPKQDDDGVGDRDLPYDLEDAVLQYVSMRWSRRGQDASVASKKVGPASVTYNGHTVPPAFKQAAQKYKRRAFA